MGAQQFEFLKSLADNLRGSADIRTIYGDPVEAEGKVVIPVAKIAYGLGGSSASGSNSIHEPSAQDGSTSAPVQGRRAGQSGGGGITVTPVGVFEITRERTRFIPVNSLRNHCMLPLLAGVMIGAILKKCKH